LEMMCVMLLNRTPVGPGNSFDRNEIRTGQMVASSRY
jgi:hypothetical protein